MSYLAFAGSTPVPAQSQRGSGNSPGSQACFDAQRACRAAVRPPGPPGYGPPTPAEKACDDENQRCHAALPEWKAMAARQRNRTILVFGSAYAISTGVAYAFTRKSKHPVGYALAGGLIGPVGYVALLFVALGGMSGAE
jgi:hypothetical protein